MYIVYDCIPGDAIFFRIPGGLEGVGFLQVPPTPKPGSLSCNDCIWLVPGTYNEDLEG